MGCSPSKPNRNIPKDPDQNSECDDKSENLDEYDSDRKLMNKYDEEIINDIRKDLNEKPEIFVLNNVLMATFFIENYKKEISEALETRLTNTENFIQPDSIIEKANKNVIYRPVHGPKQDLGEALISKRVFVPVNDSIEVVQDFESEPNWSDNEKFKVKLEESHRKGFVKLREITNSSIPYENISQIEFLNVPASSGSGSSDTDNFSDTTSATSSMSDLRIPKPLIGESETAEKYSLNNCFVYRKVKKPDIDMDLEDLDLENLTDEDVYDIVSYVSSTHFMKYFQCEVFQNSIEQMLERDNCELSRAGWLPGKIFCNLEDIDGNNYPCEILPCLTISWPEKQTFDFLNQESRTIWPNKKMLHEIKGLNCALVPKGHNNRHYKAALPKDMELEWEMHFPMAEKYLDTFLSSEQMKCFLVLLALHKEYVDPVTRQDGLLAEHIRHHIYWECDNDYSNWIEHRLGYKLLSVIYNLSAALKKRCLNDYFIQKKNMLKNMPRKYLEPSNEVFHQISQSPLMLVIRALRNLRNRHGKFYPPLDFKELIRILNVREGWELTNPDIAKEESRYAKKVKAPMFQDAEKQLKYVKMLEKKKKMLENMKRKQETKNRKNLRKKYYSIDVNIDQNDDIDDQWQCEKTFDIHKKVALLKLFIQTYIDIAKVSSKIDTNKRTLFYLKQAYYLTRILDEECAAMNDEIQYFYEVIDQEETKCLKEEDIGFIKEPRDSVHSLGQVNLQKRPSKDTLSSRSAKNSVGSKTKSENGSAKPIDSINNDNNNNKSDKVSRTADKNLKIKTISEEIHVKESINSKNSSIRKLSYSRKIIVKNQNIDGG